MNLIEALNWRYAAKKMTGEMVPADKIERIVEAARLAPTSSGLQPFNVLMITDPELKTKIRLLAHEQVVVTGCSHLLVFAAWDNYTPERINTMFDLTNEERGLKNEGWENYRRYLLSIYPQRSPEVNFNHAAKQAYIGLGMALAAAAIEKVDSTPMEGFDADGLDQLLKLPEQGLRSVAMLPLGYRDTTGDWNVNLKKIRRSRDKFIIEHK